MADLQMRFAQCLIVEGQIRLVGPGSSLCSGRVEVYHNSSWGTVCDDNWDMDDAEVVCRQLNCGTALKALATAQFGKGAGVILLDDVSCSGRERSLTQCQHNGFGSHFCKHDEDASVVCSAVLPKPSISVTPVVGLMLGQSVSVTCSITGLSGGTFILRHSDLDVQTSVSSPAIFHLTHISFGHEGYYYCVYQTLFSDQTFISPQSDSIRIQVIGPFLLVLLPSAVVLLLVLVCVVVWYVCKRRPAVDAPGRMYMYSSNQAEGDNDYCELQRVYTDEYEVIGSRRNRHELY